MVCVDDLTVLVRPCGHAGIVFYALSQICELSVLNENCRHDCYGFHAVGQIDGFLSDILQSYAEARRIKRFKLQRMIRSAPNFQIDARVLLVVREFLRKAQALRLNLHLLKLTAQFIRVRSTLAREEFECPATTTFRCVGLGLRPTRVVEMAQDRWLFSGHVRY